MGGEAAMWTEQVQGIAVESKLWPRVAALGERLWADPESGIGERIKIFNDTSRVKTINLHKSIAL